MILMPLVDVNLFNVPAFSISEDASGVLRYDGFNAAGALMTGLQSSDWIGREPRDRLPAEKAERVSVCYRRCLREGAIVEYEDEFDQPAGRLWWRTTIVPVLNTNGCVVGLIGFGVNITAQKRAESELYDAAFIDPLTGAANRRGFERAFETALTFANGGESAFTLVLADVDRFKTVNDQYGHAIGDRVLTKVTLRLRAALNDTSTIARIGGDEFAVIAKNNGRTAEEILGDIERSLDAPLDLGTQRLPIGVSLGAAEGRKGCTGAELLAEADVRMYDHKMRKKLRCR